MLQGDSVMHVHSFFFRLFIQIHLFSHIDYQEILSSLCYAVGPWLCLVCVYVNLKLLVYPSPPQPRPLLSPSSPPRPPGHCFQHKCWGHHGLFCLEVVRIFPDPGVRWAAGGNGSAPGHCGGARFLSCSRVNHTHICC